VIILALSDGSGGLEERTAVPLDQAPTAVTRAAAAAFPKGKVVSIWRVRPFCYAHPVIFHRVDIDNGGRRGSVTVGPLGHICSISERVEETALPEKCRETLTTQFPRGTAKSLHREVHLPGDRAREQEYFRVLVATADGQEMEVTMTGSGKILTQHRIESKRP
jgi:hypothetical protein